jgi:glycosyltransferase involved in cell wall biosynthesis
MKKKLLFISPRFLFPADSGGKIRTSQILRGMKGGAFEITLASPSPQKISGFQTDLDSVCDHFLSWPETNHGRLFTLTRMRHLFSPIPIPVITDRSAAGKDLVTRELANKPDVVVFDFPHSTIHAPEQIDVPSVMFTHNVEAEIFLRHTRVAGNAVTRAIWNNQYKKMLDFEQNTLARFDSNIAVSSKDADYFRNHFHLDNIREIPTGTDLDFYSYKTPKDNKRLVFTGSMDWSANIDGLSYFIESIWPDILDADPEVTLQVVGRNPPAQMVKKYSKQESGIEFTGFVDDVRTYAWNASVYIIPLRVGSGTRIKAFEAMAMGCPVVSTTLGVEGLGLEPNKHYLCADTPKEFSQAVCKLLHDKALRETLSMDARQYVEQNFSSKRVSDKFEAICLETISLKQA